MDGRPTLFATGVRHGVSWSLLSVERWPIYNVADPAPIFFKLRPSVRFAGFPGSISNCLSVSVRAPYESANKEDHHGKP